MSSQKSIEALPEEYPPKVNLEESGKFYKRPYNINAVGRDGLTTTVAIPREIIKRAAEKNKLTAQEFIKTHQAILIYNAFDGAFIRFEKKTKKESNEKTQAP